MNLRISWLVLPLVLVQGCQEPDGRGKEDAGTSDARDGESGDGQGDQASDSGDPDQGAAPRITTLVPLGAAEGVAYRYQLVCTDADEDDLTLGVGGGDSCGGELWVSGNGLAGYSFTPVDGLGGGECVLEVTCSDGSFVVTQTAQVAIAEVSLAAEGRFRRFSPIGYPGILARDVVVYLPGDYDQTQDNYPVLYLHDGQNLFDAAEAAFGVEWQVDETMDQLTAEGVLAPHIVVGIHNTSDRISDYTPDVDPLYGGGNGDLYADFIVQLLKPIIDTHFRTRPEREHTSLAGSSLGGIISLHIHRRYPQTFGGIGGISPSLWWNDRSPIKSFENFTGLLPRRLWLDMGTAEGGTDFDLMPAPLLDLRELRTLALARDPIPGDTLGYLEDPGAEHNEAAWANRLESILWFLLSETRPVDMIPGGLGLHLFHHQLDPDNNLPATSLSVELILENRVHLTLSNQGTTLTSLDTQVATVDPDGTVTAQNPGTTTIQVSAQGLEADAQLAVGQSSQTQVTFQVTVPQAPITPPNDTIYLTGSHPNLGSWDPGAVPMNSDGPDTWTITLPLPTGIELQYKYTRGTWQTVEKASDGQEIPNRLLTPSGPTLIVTDTVATWAQ